MTHEGTRDTITLPESISARIEFKRKFGFWEMYRAFVFLPRSISALRKNKKQKLLDEHFITRLNLAVTEVNGCAACSYQHTKMALREGMSGEEISSFLSGGDSFIRPEEAKALMFVQHFADARGRPKKYAWEAIVQEYGAEKARVILSAAQVMFCGNIYGIPYSAFQSRRKGKPFKDSSLFYEVGMMVAGILLLPIAIVHGLLRGLVGLPNQRLDESPVDE